MAGLAAWTFISLGNVQAQSVSSVADDPARLPVEAVSAPEASTDVPDWKSPESQDLDDPNWVYGVFTPPKIYEVDGVFSAIPPTGDDVVPTIDVQLIEMVQQLYRFQFEGYLEEDASDPRKNMAMLLDRETGFAVRARVGREFQTEGIRILDIDIKRRLNDDGLVTTIEEVKIEEIATGKEFTLENGIPKYEEEVLIRLQSTLTGETVEISPTTETFELNDLTYALLKTDVPNSQVTVRKPIETEDGEEYLTETLSVEAASDEGTVNSTSVPDLPLF